MKPWMVLCLIALSIFLSPTASAQRSARPTPTEEETAAPETFDRAQSAALFVGVRRFTHDHRLTEVKYAVDDAIDLATVFALDQRVNLVSPERVVLALSGTPRKPESQHRLDELIAAGATVAEASQADILSLAERQADLAGKDGVLIVSVSSHGFTTRDGTSYMLASSSLFEHPETSISAAKLADIAKRSNAARQLVFLDVCRERAAADTRSVDVDAAAAPLIQGMTHADGQVVFYAAAAGQYAYDDDERKRRLHRRRDRRLAMQRRHR